MRYAITIAMCWALCFCATPLVAAEIQGKVTQVEAAAITVQIGAAAKPAQGDRVEIITELVGVGDVVIAQGKVTAVLGKLILVQIDRHPERVKPDMQARIITADPSAPTEIAPVVPETPVPPPAPDPDPDPMFPPPPILPEDPADGDPPIQNGIQIPPPKTRSALAGPAARDRQITMVVVKMLEKEHFAARPVDNEIARRTLENFLKTLDPMKVYFYQSDIDRFRRQQLSLAGKLRAGDISLAYDVYRTFLDRLDIRIELVEKWIGAEHDYTVEDQLLKDAKLAEYPEDGPQADEHWRRRVKYDLLVLKHDGVGLDEARQRLIARYGSFRQRMHQTDGEELLEMFLTSLANSYNPHSNYMSPKTFKNFQILMVEEMVGIGAALKSEDGYIAATKIIPGGPAASDGRLEAGDRIVGVAQGESGKFVDVVGAKLADTVNLIRGKEGTVVRLRVLRSGQFESQVYAITRAKLDLSKTRSNLLGREHLPGGRSAKVGYIYLPSFYMDMAAARAGKTDYKCTTREMREILNGFRTQKADVVVLDLRSNGGGSLTDVLKTVGLFLGDVPVLQVKNNAGNVTHYTSGEVTAAWDGPLVILTSKYTSSGAEILAGAILDHNRGLVIGDSMTNGKGTVEMLLDLGKQLFSNIETPPDFGRLKITAQKFYLPAGDGIQGHGVSPHVVLPSLRELAHTAADQPYALSFDRVAPLEFKKSDLGGDASLIDTIRNRSQTRRKNSTYFQQLAAEIPRLAEIQGQAYVGLSEQDFSAARASKWQEEEDVEPLPGIPEVLANGHLRESLAVALDYTSRAQVRQARALVSRRRYDEAVPLYKNAIAADPGNAPAHYYLAWMLATCSQASVRDGDLAATYAERACELSRWAEWMYIFCLAVAEAEAGRFDDAVTHLQQALEKAPADRRSKYGYLEQRFENRQTYR